jgi:hypothetical protein
MEPDPTERVSSATDAKGPGGELLLTEQQHSDLPSLPFVLVFQSKSNFPINPNLNNVRGHREQRY